MNKRKKSKLGLIIILCLLIYFTYTVIDQQRIINTKVKEMESLQTKIEAETEKNQQLKEKNEMIDSDELIEQIAREELGMVKKGEKVFIDIND